MSDIRSLPEELTAILHALELRLLDPRQRQSGELAELLSPSFLEIGRSGRVYTREAVLAAMQAESAMSASLTPTLTNFSAQRLAEDAALVTYLTCRHVDPPEFALRSSIWLREEGAWRLRFHQATPCSQSALLREHSPPIQEPVCPPMTSPN